MIFVNFKSSYQGTGQRALELIRKLKDAQKETNVKIIPVPHNLDVYACLQIWKGELWIQHADMEYGDTGRTSPEIISDWDFGIDGVFLNHSEHRYHEWNRLEVTVEDCKNFNIKSMVFGGTLHEIAKITQLKKKPDFMSFEPPELIASSTTSVAEAQPDEIKKAAELAKKSEIPLIVGAGVKDRDDVRKSLELGAVGVAVSSAVVMSEDPKSVVLTLARGFSK